MNSAAKLAEVSASPRNRDLDLSPILFFEPKLVRSPLIQPNGQLRLYGYFETAPEQDKFEMGSRWTDYLDSAAAIASLMRRRRFRNSIS